MLAGQDSIVCAGRAWQRVGESARGPSGRAFERAQAHCWSRMPQLLAEELGGGPLMVPASEKTCSDGPTQRAEAPEQPRSAQIEEEMQAKKQELKEPTESSCCCAATKASVTRLAAARMPKV